jgi:hypothetical protein
VGVHRPTQAEVHDVVAEKLDHLRPVAKILKIVRIDPHNQPRRRRQLEGSKGGQATGGVENAQTPHGRVRLARQGLLLRKVAVADEDFFQIRAKAPQILVKLNPLENEISNSRS